MNLNVDEILNGFWTQIYFILPTSFNNIILVARSLFPGPKVLDSKTLEWTHGDKAISDTIACGLQYSVFIRGETELKL